MISPANLQRSTQAMQLPIPHKLAKGLRIVVTLVAELSFVQAESEEAGEGELIRGLRGLDVVANVRECVGHDEFGGNAIGTAANDAREDIDGLLLLARGAGLLESHLDHCAGHPAVVGEEIHAAHADIGNVFWFWRAAGEVMGDHAGDVSTRSSAAVAGGRCGV